MKVTKFFPFSMFFLSSVYPCASVVKNCIFIDDSLFNPDYAIDICGEFRKQFSPPIIQESQDELRI